MSINQGYIIEGFPRTMEQLVLMEMNRLQYDLVLELYQPEEVLLEKSKFREVCKKCFLSYNNSNISFGNYKLRPNPSIINGICNQCNQVLDKRLDDNITILKRRFFNYQVNHEKFKEFFAKKQKYLFFDLFNGIDDFDRIVNSIDEFLK